MRHLWPINDRIAAADNQPRKAVPTAPPLALATFAPRTKIEAPHGPDATLVPFALWPAQEGVLDAMARERQLLILKARQLGISWLACLYVLWLCAQRPNQTVLLFSRGQGEANELVRRIGVLFHHHADRAALPALVTDNTAELGWANGSRVLSLAATRNAGRSFTASLLILDEYAFMLWGPRVLASAKPTIDGGGQLFIISSADGPGTPYHQLWQQAESGASAYAPVFLPWDAHPGRDADWRARLLADPTADPPSVIREYPATPLEAFTHAAGLVYGDAYNDADGESVTADADYIPDGGVVYWAIDDGYAGAIDQTTGHFTATSHPRVFLLVQQRSDGTLCVFAESYKLERLSDDHISDVLALGYPLPMACAVDSSAAELRARLNAQGLSTIKASHPVDEGIKETRRRLKADANGVRHIRIHPRCTHLRRELLTYRVDSKGEPVKAFDHGADCLRYLCWVTRFQQ